MNFFHFQQLPAVRSGLRTPLRTTDSNLEVDGVLKHWYILVSFSRFFFTIVRDCKKSNSKVWKLVTRPVLSQLRQHSGRRGGSQLLQVLLFNLPLRAKHQTESLKQDFSQAERSGRRFGRVCRLGERRFHRSHLSKVRTRQGVLHADPDTVRRWAHDYFLQVLPSEVLSPMARLTFSRYGH